MGGSPWGKTTCRMGRYVCWKASLVVLWAKVWHAKASGSLKVKAASWTGPGNKPALNSAAATMVQHNDVAQHLTGGQIKSPLGGSAKPPGRRRLGEDPCLEHGWLQTKKEWEESQTEPQVSSQITSCKSLVPGLFQCTPSFQKVMGELWLGKFLRAGTMLETGETGQVRWASRGGGG